MAGPVDPAMPAMNAALDQRSRPRAASASSSASTSTSRSRTARSPTTRASARRCRPSRYALEQGATVILASHLGRPKGKPTPEFSLQPVADAAGRAARSARWRSRPTASASRRTAAVAAHAPGGSSVVLLENLRFHAEEEKNDPAFAAALAALADVYVNDAFGAAHRAHASMAGMVSASQVRRPAAGLLMEKELDATSAWRSSDPERPFVAILGGAKVSDKIEVIENLLGRVDRLLIGGAMAYTFLKAHGDAGRASRSSRTTSWTRRARIDVARQGARRARCSCPSTTSSPTSSTRRPPRPTLTVERSRPSASGWASTSARRPRGSTRTCSPTRRPSSGTARWACSRSAPFAAGTTGRGAAPWPAVQGTTIIGGGDSVAAGQRRPASPIEDDAHLDRRRRLARVPRRHGAAGRRGASRQE